MTHTDEAGFLTAVSDDLRSKIRASFFMLLQSGLDLRTGDMSAISEFDGTRPHILEMIAMPVPQPEDERAALREAVSGYRETIIGACSRLTRIRAYLSLAENWMTRAVFLMLAHDAPPQNDGIGLFSVHMESLLTETQKGEPRSLDTNLLSTFMSHIPLRMTTARYNDYIREAFLASEETLYSDSLALYKAAFNPTDALSDGTGVAYFNELKQILDDIWQADLESWTPQEKSAGKERLIDASEILIKTYAQLSTLFDAVNALLIILTGQDEEQHITGLHSYREEFASPRDDFDDRLEAAVLQAMKDIVYGPEDDPFADGVPADGAERELYDKWNRIQLLFYESGLDYIGTNGSLRAADNSQSCNECDEETFLSELLSYIAQCVSGLPAKRRRFLRQHFLQYLSYPYELDDYKQYFTDTYDSLDNINRALLYLYVMKSDKTGRFDQVLDKIPTESSEDHADSNL